MIDSMVIAGVSSVVMLASVTIWTGVVLVARSQSRPRRRRTAAGVVVHPVGPASPRLPAAALVRRGRAAMACSSTSSSCSRSASACCSSCSATSAIELSERTAELEQLTRLLLRAQEDERRRIARELHDEAGQALTAVKIELDLDGHRDAGEKVGRALAQVRDLSNLLRPSALDDLGLSAALRALAADVSRAVANQGRPRYRNRRPHLLAGDRSRPLSRRPGSPDQHRPARQGHVGARAAGDARPRRVR